MHHRRPLPRILVFEDDPQIRELWEMLAYDERLIEFYLFPCWEEFIKGHHGPLAEGAVAFVDFHFHGAGSKVNGLQIEMELRRLGIAKVISVSANPLAEPQILKRFELVLGAKIPGSVRQIVTDLLP